MAVVMQHNNENPKFLIMIMIKGLSSGYKTKSGKSNLEYSLCFILECHLCTVRKLLKRQYKTACNAFYIDYVTAGCAVSFFCNLTSLQITA